MTKVPFMRSLGKAAPEIRRGHRVERMPVKPTSPFVADGLHESDLITPAGVINRSMLMRIAAYRAQRELEAYAAMGAPRPRSELLGEELRRTWSIAKLMHECEAGRRAFARMTPTERHIRQLELRLEKLRRGLATPSCVKTQDDIAHYETLLARARVAIAEAAE